MKENIKWLKAAIKDVKESVEYCQRELYMDTVRLLAYEQALKDAEESEKLHGKRNYTRKIKPRVDVAEIIEAEPKRRGRKPKLRVIEV